MLCLDNGQYAKEQAKKYNILKARLDLATRLLCDRCKILKNNHVLQYQSQELQDWAKQHWEEDNEKGLFPH